MQGEHVGLERTPFGPNLPQSARFPSPAVCPTFGMASGEVMNTAMWSADRSGEDNYATGDGLTSEQEFDKGGGLRGVFIRRRQL